jgi:hypothetical protein
MDDKYIEDLREQYEELCYCEEEIKNNLKKNKGFEKKFKKYGLLDKKWVDAYKKYLFDSLKDKVRGRFIFKDSFSPEKEEKIFCLITENKSYYFPINFILVSEKFINLLSKNIKDKEYLHKFNSRIYYIAFVGKFIIRKDGKTDDNYYITLYNESQNNNVDFILYYCIKENSEIQKNLNIIFNNDFFHYIEINNFTHEEDSNIILNDKKEKIGYLLHNCDKNRCHYIFQMKNKSNLNNNLNLNYTINLSNSMNNNMINNMINNMNNKMALLNLNNNSNINMNFMNNNNNNNFFNGSMNINNNYISYLENELQKSKKVIEDQKVIISNLQNQLNNEKNINFNNMNLIQSLQNLIKEKEQELTKLINQFQNINQNKSRYGREEMMCVNFMSLDQKIQYAIPCTGDDIFAEIEEKLYKKFPQYRETNNYFLSNGKQILRFKTISQNNIGGFPVVMSIP